VRRIDFYALRDDLLPVLQEVEAHRPLEYVRMEHYRVGTPLDRYERADDLPRMSEADCDDSISCSSYLIIDRGCEVVRRRIDRNDGSTVEAIDQGMNPETLTLTAGGRRGDALLAGRIATAYDSVALRALMNACKKAFTARFTKIDRYRVGSRAAAFLDAGGRLTASLQSPAEYNLARR
jgi:hypothetical protein